MQTSPDTAPSEIYTTKDRTMNGDSIGKCARFNMRHQSNSLVHI